MSAGSGKGAQINMTPLIDVVLVLLVIVMLTAQVAAHTQRALATNLPQAASALPLDATHVVTLREDGAFFFDHQPCSPAHLAEHLRATGSRHERVLLEVESEVAHRRVIEVLDLLSAEGVTDAAFSANERK